MSVLALMHSSLECMSFQTINVTPVLEAFVDLHANGSPFEPKAPPKQSTFCRSQTYVA